MLMLYYVLMYEYYNNVENTLYDFNEFVVKCVHTYRIRR